MKIKTMLAVIAGALGLAATADVTLPTGTSKVDETHDSYYKVAEKVNKNNVIFIVDDQESDPIVIEEGQTVPAGQIPTITCNAWQTPQWTKEGVVVDPSKVEIKDNTTDITLTDVFPGIGAA